MDPVRLQALSIAREQAERAEHTGMLVDEGYLAD